MTTFLIGFLLGATVAGLLLANQARRVRRDYSYACRQRRAKRVYRNRLAETWVRLHNQDIYVDELERRLERGAPVLVWLSSGPAMSDESGPTTGIEFYLN